MSTAWTDRLFVRLGEIYGASRVLQQYGSDAHRTWAAALSGLSGDDIARGLKICALHCENGAEQWPPSLPLFRHRCRSASRGESEQTAMMLEHHRTYPGPSRVGYQALDDIRDLLGMGPSPHRDVAEREEA